jgi:hypothetical protein
LRCSAPGKYTRNCQRKYREKMTAIEARPRGKVSLPRIRIAA